MPTHGRLPLLPRLARPSRAASTWLRRGLVLVGGAAAIGAVGLVLATQASAVAAPVDPAQGIQVQIQVQIHVQVQVQVPVSQPALNQAPDPAAARPVLQPTVRSAARSAVEPVVATARETVVEMAPEVDRVARLLPLAPLVALPLARPAALLTRADAVVSLRADPAVRSTAAGPVDQTPAASPTRSRPSAAPAVGRSTELAARVGVSQSSDGGSPVGPGGSGGSGWGVVASPSSIGTRGSGGQVAVGLALVVAATGARRLGVGREDVGLRLARRALDVPVTPA